MKLKINKKELFIFFLLIWFFEPTFFSRFPIIDLIFTIGKIVAFCSFIIFVLFGDKKKYQPSSVLILAIAIEIICLGVTFVYEGAILTQIIFISSMMLLVIVDYYLNTVTDHLIRVLISIFEILIYANFICILLFPNGLYNFEGTRHYWLFGHVNSTIIYILPAIVLAGIMIEKGSNKLLSKKNIRPILLIIISITTILITWSATAIMGLLIMLIITIANRKKVYFTATQAVILSLVIFILINVLQFQGDILGSIVGLLGRDITFSGRTEVWNRAIETIQEHLIFGYGAESNTVIVSRLLFSQPHCRYFNLLYRGGCVSFILQLIAFFICARTLDKSKRSALSCFIIAGYWALMVQIAFESYFSPIFYLIFLFGSNIHKLRTTK